MPWTHVMAKISYSVVMYGTAEIKLDIYMCVALELFNKLVEPLASYMRVHDTISYVI